MASDLLSIGASGVLAQQKMLSTTSNNISNVSTAGYVRQSTVLYSNQNTLGVGDSVTRRLFDIYAQSQVWQDTSSYNEINTTYSQVSELDKYLSNSATSISTGLDSFFSALQSANSSPNMTASRQNIMGQITSLASQFQTVSSSVSELYDGINNKISTEADNINSLLSSLTDINKQILKSPIQDDDGSRLNLLDQRDEMIRQLSEKLDIRTVDLGNGIKQVNLSSGQTLVFPDANATFSVVAGDPNPKNTALLLKLGNSQTKLSGDGIGGSLGGYFTSRSVIEDTQKQIGQLSLAFADAMNTQNKLGMTLNNTIGSDLYTLPTSYGLSYGSNIGSGNIAVNVIPGQGSNISPNDLQIEFSSATNYTVYLLDSDTKTSMMTGTTPPNTFDITDSSGNSYGLAFTVSGTPGVGDKFLLQPTRYVAQSMSASISRSEDLALASPLQLNANANNYSTASISLDGIYNTDSTTSAFSASDLQVTAPHKIVINSTGDYDIYDGQSPIASLLGTAPASSNGKNILASSGIYPDPKVDPGFEISIDGSVTVSDEFYISFNTNGFSDNTNGLALAGLQTKDFVRKGNSNADDNKMTFSEAFNSTITSVGTTVSMLNVSNTAADAKLTQSQELFQSVAGVNLDEEASNLIRYQQAYAASAQVVSAARDTFDTLLSAMG
nr:flagellar hook-associated protein FlgK [uncultured Tolumonas sp.]